MKKLILFSITAISLFFTHGAYSWDQFLTFSFKNQTDGKLKIQLYFKSGNHGATCTPAEEFSIEEGRHYIHKAHCKHVNKIIIDAISGKASHLRNNTLDLSEIFPPYNFIISNNEDGSLKGTRE